MTHVLQPLDVNIHNNKGASAPVLINPDSLCSPGPKKIITGVRSTSSGENIVTEYILSAFLGKGAFAQCYKMRDRQTGQVYAGKVIEKAGLTKPHSKHKLVMEIKIHKALKHQNIVQFHSFFQDSQNFYILLEMCNQKTLRDVVRQRKTITEAEARYYLLQTIDAVKYLHSKNIIHRDLKLDNIFIHDMKIKIGDFGLAAHLKDPKEKKKTLCGTPNYIAPEVLDSTKGHSFEVDVWAIGVILYSLLIGKPPFETKTVEETYSRIRNNEYSFPAGKPISEEAKALIKKLLHPEPAGRPKFDEILADPFFFRRHVPSHLSCNALHVVPPAEVVNSPKKSPCRKRKFVIDDCTEKEPASKAIKFESNTSPSQGIKRMSLNKHVPSTTALEHLHDAISTYIATRPTRARRTSNTAMTFHAKEAPTNLWVAKWVDYSYKFGLGYQFCDGTLAVSFNDYTKTSLSPCGSKIEFLDPYHIPEGGKTPVSQILKPSEYSQYSARIQKRLTLLNYFKSYLLKCGESQGLESAGADVASDAGTFPYVAAWKRTSDAILFHLSNNAVQINFHDHTKIVVSPEPNVVTFVNKKGVRTTHYLHDCLAPSDELLRRLKYLRDCLQQLIQANLTDSKSTELNVGPIA